MPYMYLYVVDAIFEESEDNQSTTFITAAEGVATKNATQENDSLESNGVFGNVIEYADTEL